MTREPSRAAESGLASAELSVQRCRRLPVAILIVVLSTGLAASCGKPTSATGVVLDAYGHPLPRGTELEGSLEYPDAGFYNPWVERIVVGRKGRFRLPQHRFPGRAYLLLQRTDDDGVRSRVLVKLRCVDAGTVQLERETLLASGRVIDESGQPLPSHRVHLVVTPAAARRGTMLPHWLGARWVREDGRYELHGWLAPGESTIRSSYVPQGPEGEPVVLQPGREDLTITLPDTGYLHQQVALPEPFPENGLWAVLRDGTSDEVVRKSQRSGRVRIRARTGRYRVSYEINGEAVADLGQVIVQHEEITELPLHDLRDQVRVIRVEVVAEDGTPHLGARVRVRGAPEDLEYTHDLQRGTGKWEIHVPVTKPAVDLEVFASAYRDVPTLIRDVSESLRVVVE